jgi:2'-5' RNA ligase superfamily protein
MNRDQPLVTDPIQLSTLAGRAVLCLRPTGPVATAFHHVQRRLRVVVGSDPAWWPDVHLSLKGFGDERTVVDKAKEWDMVKLAQAWARSTPPLVLATDGLDVFAEELIPIIRVLRTPELAAALDDVRGQSEASVLPGYADRISIEEWVFHLSLMYYRGDRWRAIEDATNDIVIQRVEEVVDHVELRVFDGGPERLVGRFPLAG